MKIGLLNKREKHVPSSDQWKVWVLPDMETQFFTSVQLSLALLSPPQWGPSMSMETPASSTHKTCSGEGYRAAKYLLMGPTQQPSQERVEPLIQTNAQPQQRPLTGSKPRSAPSAARGMFSGQLQPQPQWGEVWHQTTTSCGLLWHFRREGKKGKEECLIFHSFLSDLLLIFTLFFLLPKLSFSDVQGGQLLLLHYWKVAGSGFWTKYSALSERGITSPCDSQRIDLHTKRNTKYFQ